MTTKIALSGLCALILVASVGCSTTKTAANPASVKSNSNATAQATDPNLPAVGEGPTTTPGHAWGNNISPYFN